MNRYKSFIITLALSAVCPLVFGQSEKIELPDVTTIVEGENQTLRLPAPDLELAAPLPVKSGSIVPELPPLPPVEEVKPVEEVVQHGSGAKVTGTVGGGYPPSFIGQFEVKNNSETDPYSIEFIHDSVAGMAGLPLTDGYNSINTGILFYKAFALSYGNLELNGNYTSNTNGFQTKVEDLSALNQNSVDIGVDYKLKFTRGSELFANLNGNFYNRYSDITDSSIEKSWQTESQTLSVSPTIGYKTSFLDDTLGLSAYGTYNMDMDLVGNLVDESSIYTSGKVLNRGQLCADVNWKNDYVYIAGNAGLVFGDHQNGNKVIVPFSTKAVFSVPVKESNSIGFLVEGGLKTSKNDIAVLEKQYKYSAFDCIPEETSDWYGLVESKVLIDNKFYLTAGLDYKKTTFDNGIWVPDYEGLKDYGVYKYKQQDRSSLSGNVSVDFNYKLFKITGKFTVNLFDLEPLQNRWEYYAKAEYDSVTKWKAFVEVQGALDSQDLWPVVNTEVTLRLSPQSNDSLQISLLAKDLFKLVTGSSRDYAGGYICDSGSISLLLKFTL